MLYLLINTSLAFLPPHKDKKIIEEKSSENLLLHNYCGFLNVFNTAL